MSVSLEWKKVKRTGFLPAFFGGGTLAAIVPIINMAVRPERYLNQQGSPVQILLDANWQMMAMLNVADSSRNLPFISHGICRQRYAETEILTSQGKFRFLRESRFDDFNELFCSCDRSSGGRILYLSLVWNRKRFF